MRICLTILLFTLIGFKALAQRPDTTSSQTGTDSLKQVPAHATLKPFKPQKTVVMRRSGPDSTHSPHKAVMRSLMIPGWGQLYNREWYYVPLIYGGLASFSYYMIYNLNDYHKYLAEAKFRDAGKIHTNPKDDFANVSGGSQQFYDVAAGAQRNFQICILGIVGVWGINCIEAYIGAKFIHSYTIDNNLSFKVTPSLLNQPTIAFNNNSYIPGIKLTLAVR